MRKRYIGFKTHDDMLKHIEENKHVSLGSGWSKENKHFYEVEE